MANLECLTGLVALSNRDFACFTDERPADYNQSTSGYSLTDSDLGCGMIDACEVKGWELLARGLANGIRDFKTDLGGALLNENDPAVTAHNGFIGKMQSSGYSQPSLPYIGHKYTPVYQRGVKMVIKAFYLGLETGGTYNIRVRSNDPTAPLTFVKAGTVTGNAFGKVQLAADEILELPFYSDAIDNLQYLVSVERNGVNPLYNGFGKCCGSKPGYLNLMEASGFQATSATGDNLSKSGSAYGLVVDAMIVCDELGWICELPVIGQYLTLDLCARTIQFRGAFHAISEMLETQAITLCTQYQLDQLVAKRNYLAGLYDNNIRWISQNLPKGVTNCFTCKKEDTFFRTSYKI